MDLRRAAGSWLEGPQAAAAAEGVEFGRRGERLGLPPSGPGSVVGFAGRTGAFVVDAVPCALISWAVFRGPEWTTWIFLAEVLLGTWLAGASFGQRVTRMRIVRLDGSRAGFPRALLRTALLALLIPAVVTDRDGRGLHDRAAGTVLVRI